MILNYIWIVNDKKEIDATLLGRYITNMEEQGWELKFVDNGNYHWKKKVLTEK